MVSSRSFLKHFLQVKASDQCVQRLATLASSSGWFTNWDHCLQRPPTETSWSLPLFYTWSMYWGSRLLAIAGALYQSSYPGLIQDCLYVWLFFIPFDPSQSSRTPSMWDEISMKTSFPYNTKNSVSPIWFSTSLDAYRNGQYWPQRARHDWSRACVWFHSFGLVIGLGMEHGS